MGAAFGGLGPAQPQQLPQNNLEFGQELGNGQSGFKFANNRPPQLDGSNLFARPQQFPSLSNTDNNNPARKTFGSPFGKSPQVIVGPQNRPDLNVAESDVEVFSEVLRQSKCCQAGEM